MKNLLTKTFFLSIALLLLGSPLFFSACNKETPEVERAMHILINGYNGGDHPLVVAIDTTVFDHKEGAFIIKPQSNIHFTTAFSYKVPKKRLVTLTDTVTKKVVYSAELPENTIKVNFNYLYFDGKVQELTPPAADPNVNKLGFYIYDKSIDFPIDISLQKVNATSGDVRKEYIAKNVLPGRWFYVDYLPPKDFDKNADLMSATVHFTKANTDEWAFEGDETKSKLPAGGFFFPKLNDKGKVQPYFIAPKVPNQTFSRLFFYLD
ncbi:hypothetical protein [Sphingobacterium sp. DR205]|uniref:hypothetical protein n=1 Tax=Sphingobacterium sp. DR205 TaxID=2713573 RepID=UPI0013E42469|nr:hypothetical protein [Sphingobacterium sp. DR205]QIH34659.1 hypothetical protein G6053_17955 [Sphingobacterium sp. DR205]